MKEENVYNKLDIRGRIVGSIVLEEGLSDSEALELCRKLTGWPLWEKRVAPTPEEIAKAARAVAMLSGAPYTLNGVEYQISFTKDDGDGMMQVKTAFDLGVEATNIHFENGTAMPITAVEFTAFAAWFVAKRNEFFV